jgi:hypothetical protein
MQPLIDGDVLVYECAAVGQYKDDPKDEAWQLRSWDWLAELIDEKIEAICRAVEATQKPIVYLTGDPTLHAMKRRVCPSLPDYEPNFRIARASLRPYKGTRKVEKPYYYNSVRAYLLTKYNAHVAIGCEADDEMAMEQTKRPEEVIVCTRDKDLRQVAGWHYGWESGKQPEFEPTRYDELGRIDLVRTPSTTKIAGGGFRFFCSQLLTGDPVDNIAGLPKYGPVSVYSLLEGAGTLSECLSIVRNEYEHVYAGDWKPQLREQCDLLWMIRRRDASGNLVMFNPKDYA